MYEWPTQKGYTASVAFETFTCTLRSSESCTAFLVDCTDQGNPTNAHLNRLRALKEMLRGQEQDILAMLGNVKLKLGKRLRKPIYIVDEAALKGGRGRCQALVWMVS